MRVLLVEPDYDGHHLASYVRLIAREAHTRGWHVSLLTTHAARLHPSFDLVAAEFEGEVPILIMNQPLSRRANSSFSLLRAQLSLWRALRASYFDNEKFDGFDIVYFINLDYFEKWIPMLGMPFGTKASAGMLMNPKFHRAKMKLGPPSRNDWIYGALFQRMLRIHALRNIAVIDEQFKTFCVERGYLGAEKLTVVPDVGEVQNLVSRHTARSSLEIPEDAFVVLLYGKITRRKGVEGFIRAVEYSDRTKVIGLIAGVLDDDIRHFVRSAAGRRLAQRRRLVIRDEFHDDVSECQVFRAADLVWLGYDGGAYGSSGVLYQAGSAGLPVLAMKEGLIGWLVRQYSLGITVNPRDAEEVSRAIEQLQANTKLYQQMCANGKAISSRHTGAAFGRAVCEIIQRSV